MNKSVRNCNEGGYSNLITVSVWTPFFVKFCFVQLLTPWTLLMLSNPSDLIAKQSVLDCAMFCYFALVMQSSNYSNWVLLVLHAT